MSNTPSTNAGGISISTLLGIVFVTLKLLGVITWSWLWVLSPFWIPLVLFGGILLVVGIIALITLLIVGIAARK